MKKTVQIKLHKLLKEIDKCKENIIVERNKIGEIIEEAEELISDLDDGVYNIEEGIDMIQESLNNFCISK